MSICQSCGACCATFRVDFHPAELAGGAFAWGQGVLPALTVPVTTVIVRMSGSDATEPRCIALAGEVEKPLPARSTTPARRRAANSTPPTTPAPVPAVATDCHR